MFLRQNNITSRTMWHEEQRPHQQVTIPLHLRVNHNNNNNNDNTIAESSKSDNHHHHHKEMNASCEKDNIQHLRHAEEEEEGKESRPASPDGRSVVGMRHYYQQQSQEKDKENQEQQQQPEQQRLLERNQSCDSITERKRCGKSHIWF